jgi:tetratricopeptide (TPR) repeat protein
MILYILRSVILKNKYYISSRAALIIFIPFLLFTWACSTQKNTLPNRLYHSINAKYNGYFNARESYREGVRRLSAAHNDNYEQVLSIFRYGNEQQAGVVSSYMDVAYQKASIVIRRHSMNIRGIEYNPYIDASFYLIARSHFFKRDYNLAILTFEYIVRQYDPPAKYLAKAWIAKSYHQLNRHDDAFRMLEMLKANRDAGQLDRETERMYMLVMADHHIRTDNFLAAIPFLQNGASLTSNKREKTRLAFIEAQLYHHSGDYTNAQQTYARVLRMNPSFELAFQSRISMAMAYDPGEGGGDFIESELNRMLRDDKNRAFRDQIYYALAQLNQRRGREEQAIEMLLKSTEVSEDNRIQKGLSFKRLGEIYFSRPEYLKSSIYYDSAVVYLPSQHDDFVVVNQQKAVLSSLAANIRTIAREDSLQRLAAMPETARNAVINKIIEELREEERQARLVEQQMMRAASTIAQTRIRGGVGAQEGGWYFYNTTAMSFGRTEFFSKFGDRPLEDNWRVRNRRGGDFDMAMDDEWEEDEEEAGDIFDRNTYLRNIPLTEEQMIASNLRIANAYYNKGLIFNERLRDYRSAVNSLETLVDRFPDSERKLYSYYYLFTLHRELNDPSRANMYKDRLLAEFPDSEFADILGDPNYLEKVIERQQYGKRLYEQAYRAFLNQQYQDVIEASIAADTLDLPRSVQSQFAYIKALSIGKLGKKSEFKKELEYVVESYNGLPVYEPASYLLASLNLPGSLPLEFEEEASEPASELIADREISTVFSYNPDAVHFFVIIAETGKVDVPQVRNMINLFNQAHFGGRQLSASSIFLDDKRQILTVTNFPGKENGMEYYNKLMESEELQAFDMDILTGFIISVENYPIFYQEKNLDEYKAFFRQKYIGQ